MPDAKLIDIENLVIWAFQSECASLHDVGLDVTAGYPEDCIIRCERVSVMGGFITGTSPGARVVAGDSHPDAVAVTDAMTKLHPPVARLVASHGKAGTRPDWKRYARFRFEPRLWDCDESGEEWGIAEIVHLDEADGAWPADYFDKRKGRTVKAPRSRWVPITAKDAPAVVRTARAVYVQWWDGLHALGMALHGSLADWRLSDVMPDREPWAARRRAA